jgi:hypothetical protein
MNNVTFIDDLPTIEELELPKSPGMTMIPPDEVNKFQKYIRNNSMNFAPESGMMMEKRRPSPQQQQHEKYQQQLPNDPNNLREQMYKQADFDPQLHRYHPPIDKYAHGEKYADKYNPYHAERIYENFAEPSVTTTSPPKKSELSCVDIAEHTANCLVCSKLYANNNMLLIILVIFLALVNLLLLKRILET